MAYQVTQIVRRCHDANDTQTLGFNYLERKSQLKYY